MASEFQIRSGVKTVLIVAIAAITGLSLLRGVPLGLDLRGGVEWVFRIDTEQLPPERRGTAVQETIDVIRRRIDPTGQMEMDIRAQGKERFYVQIPGLTKEETGRIHKRMMQAGKLLFCLVSESEADQARAERGEAVIGHTPFIQRSTLDPRTGKTRQRYYRVTYRELQRELVQHPEGEERKKAAWLLVENRSEVQGKYLAAAYLDRDKMGGPAVGFRFRGEGARQFEWVTENNKKRQLAIILDDVLYSAPVIQSRISGAGIIEGGRFTRDEVNDLIVTLRAGSLPTDIELEWTNRVGPTLGSDSIRAGLIACIISLILVLAFMGTYYLLLGAVADFVLMLNLLIVVGALALTRAVLTLPGIAGLILTVGMSVDANVLIFERIREESARGKTTRLALRNGFERAFTTIIDANVTTLLTAFILFWAGTGPVRGFAVTLSIGILSSMFCALVVTRLVLELLQAGNVLRRFRMFQLFARPHIRFSRMRFIGYACSLTAITMGLIFFVARGKKKYDTDLIGGTRLDMQLRPGLSIGQVRARVTRIYPEAEVQSLSEEGTLKGGTATAFSIRVKELSPQRAHEKITADLNAVAAQKEAPRVAGETDAWTAFSLALSRPLDEGVLRERLRAAGYPPGHIVRLLHEGRPATNFQLRLRYGGKIKTAQDLDNVIGDIRQALAGVLWADDVPMTIGELTQEEPDLDTGRPVRWRLEIEFAQPSALRAIREAIIAHLLGGKRPEERDLHVYGGGEDAGAQVVRKVRVTGEQDLLDEIARSQKKALRIAAFEQVGPGLLRITTREPMGEADLWKELATRHVDRLCGAVVPVGVSSGLYEVRLKKHNENPLSDAKTQEKIREDLSREFADDILLDRLSVHFREAAPPKELVKDPGLLKDEGYRIYEMNIEQSRTYQFVRNTLRGANEADALILPPEGLSAVASKATTAFYFKWRVEQKADEKTVAEAQQRIVDAFANPDPFRRIETIGPTMAGEMKNKAYLAMFLALVVVVFYIWFRFGEVKFGLAAIIALAHDVLFTMGAIAVADALSGTAVGQALMFRDIKINLPMIAAFLTIIGYSLNDTIVVFDRIRENMGGARRQVEARIIDMSVNQTLSRTVLTSLTTLLVVVVLYLVGGSVIHGFAFALTVGVVVGTYSSVFVASPVLLDWPRIVAPFYRRRVQGLVAGIVILAVVGGILEVIRYEFFAESPAGIAVALGLAAIPAVYGGIRFARRK